MTSGKLKSLLFAAGVYPDVVRRKGNTFEVKNGYFYAHGRTADKWATSVQAALVKAGLSLTVIDVRDDWKAWPKDSYFVAVVS